jgi:hypothetical protein
MAIRLGMFPADEYSGALVPQRPEFNTTHWSVVLAARGESNDVIGGELGMSTGAVKQAVRRLRQRNRELLHEEVAQTVATAADIDDEVRHLVAVLRGA